MYLQQTQNTTRQRTPVLALAFSVKVWQQNYVSSQASSLAETLNANTTQASGQGQYT